MSSEPLGDVLLASDTVGVLTIAATNRTGPVTTYDVLAAIIAVDRHSDWDTVQLRSTWLSDADAGRFFDDDGLVEGAWKGVPFTEQATAALRTAAEIAEAYKLLPVPPGVLALGVVWDPSSGASRALLADADLSHGELLDLIQESVLGTRLMSLESAVSNVRAQTEDNSSESLDELTVLLRSASLHVPEAEGGRYVVVTTAAVMLALASENEAEWAEAAHRAGISLNAYLENLRWISEHPTEAITDDQVVVDERLADLRVTTELAASLAIADRISVDLAGGETTHMRGLVPAVLLTLTENDAATGLSEAARYELRTALLQTLHGALIHDLDDRVQALRIALRDGQAGPPASASGRAASLGFSVGTFLGAFVISLVGGIPLFLALGLAWLVRTAAARARRRPRRSRLLPPIAATTLVIAILLAAGAGFDFKDDRRAVLKLESAEAAIERSDLVQAMRQLAGAALLQQESVRITVLQACVVWDMGFKDEAAAEAQMALNLGHRPDEQSHYRGRGCFLDALDFRGLGVIRSSSVPQWLLYPRPIADDSVGQRYLEIAQEQRNTDTPTQAVIALGCLADLYDLRSLASFYFTVGLNTEHRLGNGPTPFPEIRRCLGSESTKSGYRFVRPHGSEDDELFFPADASKRIPSPTYTQPPKDACWAKFPRGGPCNAHD